MLILTSANSKLMKTQLLTNGLSVAGVTSISSMIESQSEAYHDFSYRLSTECLPDLKIESCDRFMKARGSYSKADRDAVSLHGNALSTISPEDPNLVMQEASALPIGMDDGPNK